MKRKFTNSLVGRIFIAFTFLWPSFIFAQVKHTVTFNKDDFTIVNEKAADSNLYTSIRGKKYPYIQKQGNPFLLVKYVKLYLPEGQGIITLTVNSVIKESIALENMLLPCQPSIPTLPGYKLPNFIKPNDSIYAKNTPFPLQAAEIVREGWFDGINHIVTVAVYPFQYIPGQRKVVFYSSVNFTINTKKTLLKSSQTVQQGKKNRREEVNKMYHNILTGMVENSGEIPAYDATIETTISQSTKLKSAALNWTVPFYEYVVVTSQALAPAFSEFVAWEKRKGLNAGVVTIEDIMADHNADHDPVNSNMTDSAAKLRKYLSDAYLYGTIYALLGGDNALVPIRYGCGQNNDWNEYYWINGVRYTLYDAYKIPSDLYFADFDGDWNYDNDSYTGEESNDRVDYNPEIFVGRILCTNTSDVLNWIKREIIYEKNPGNGVNTYLTKSFMTQADHMQNGNEGGKIAAHLPQFTHTIWNEKPLNSSPDPTNDSTRHAYAKTYHPQFPKGAQVVAELNSHYGLYSMFNHGVPQGVALATDSIMKYADNYAFFICSQDIFDTQRPAIIDESLNGFDDLNNASFPTIIYSVSCETTPFDNYEPQSGIKNMGYNFTASSNGGGPAYLGNTRHGWVGTSAALYDSFAIRLPVCQNLGVLEGVSKSVFNDHYTILSHNLVGDPETPMWTAIPSTFNLASVVEYNNSVTVNTGGPTGANMCVMSALDNGVSYFKDTTVNQQSVTFNNVVKPYYVTITKQNYLPYLKNPGPLYIQNDTLNYSLSYINCLSVAAGHHVTDTKPQGDVLIPSGAIVTFDATGDILLDKGFEVQLGAYFEAK
jgi:hypothetical protein